MAVKLGDKVKDVITGFEGTMVSETKFLHGCKRFGIQPVIDKDGKLPEPQWFDEPRVELVEAREIPDTTRGAVKETGGMDNVPRRDPPPRREAVPSA